MSSSTSPEPHNSNSSSSSHRRGQGGGGGGAAKMRQLADPRSASSSPCSSPGTCKPSLAVPACRMASAISFCMSLSSLTDVSTQLPPFLLPRRPSLLSLPTFRPFFPTFRPSFCRPFYLLPPVPCHDRNPHPSNRMGPPSPFLTIRPGEEQRQPVPRPQ